MSCRLLRHAALIAALLLAACDGDGPVDPGAGPARLRVFNAVVSPGADPIEVRADSSAVLGAAVPQSESTAFAEIGAGTHRFEARLAGATRDLFGGSARAVMVGGFGYTLLAVGTVPAFGTPDVRPLLVADDPFPPSRVPGGTAYHARIQVVNAAPFAGTTGTGALVQAYITEGDAPASIGGVAPSLTIGYRNASTPLELPAGRYTVTLARLNGAVVARQTIELGAGHARTLVLASSGATASPSPDNHRIVVLADRDF
ncbi:DUF4397 domain-containing protein [Longimicrobium sp.]|uniref:DUF4397 domain-containing protein n=1 Tax=Longimicrobium sp. TaxID=2029185 RepID=UPI003B3AE4BD